MRAALALLALAGFLGGSSAMAAGACGPRTEMLKYLKSEYQEVVFGQGVTAGGATIIEMTVSPKGTYTVLMTNIDGASCIMAAGTSWTMGPLKPGRGT